MTLKTTITCDKCQQELDANDSDSYELRLDSRPLKLQRFGAANYFSPIITFHLCSTCAHSKTKVFVREPVEDMTQAQRVTQLLHELLESMGVSPQE